MTSVLDDFCPVGFVSLDPYTAVFRPYVEIRVIRFAWGSLVLSRQVEEVALFECEVFVDVDTIGFCFSCC